MVMLSACAATRHSTDVDKSGFLGEALYEKMRPVRIQVAVTDYEQSWVALNMISTVIPQLRAVSTLKMLATEKPAFVGAAQIEVKLSNAQTGDIVAAGVDRWVGGKKLTKGIDNWTDVKNAFDCGSPALCGWVQLSRKAEGVTQLRRQPRFLERKLIAG